MIDLKKILCPTDFSVQADHALAYAMEFAKRTGATLVLHHALYVPYLAMAHDMGPDVHQAREAMLAESRRLLAEKEEVLKAEGFKVETHLTVGNPFTDIVNLAREVEADLIVISTHGRGAVAQLLMGSTAERVVNQAPCPVLTVKHPEHEFVHP